MPIDTHPARTRGRTPEQIIAQQKHDAAKDRARAAALKVSPQAPPPVPAKVTPVASTAVTSPVPDTRTEPERYVDETAPASIVGRMIKFSKDNKFVTADDDKPIDESARFIRGSSRQVSRRINDGETPPDRVQGLLYDGFVVPPREMLGDMDQSQWGPGLSGKPEDPWKHQNCLVLQQTETRELYTFVTTSETGRRAVCNLLRHYNRTRKAKTDEVPVVRLHIGGFNHRDPRVGWVPTPMFAIVGKTPRDSAAKPDTSLAGDMNDELPPGMR